MMDRATELQRHVAAWVTAWTSLRSYQVSAGPGYVAALRLDRNGDWEYFIAAPTPAAFATVAAEVVSSPRRALCVIGSDVHGYVKQAHRAGLGMISNSEQLMILAIESQDNQDPFLADPELSLVVKEIGGKHSDTACQARFSAAILRGQKVLANGKVGIYGDYAVFDQLETHAQHRRRGYGMLLMRALTARALEHPVTTGLLLASTDGQRLYHKLGWRSLGSVTVLVPRARLLEMAANS
ncbi:GNAT family N-acetyltransferase [Arthrobacter sp. TMN-49]